MSDIFQEVQDDVRHDRLMALWRGYGKYAIAAAAALVLGTAGWKGWSAYSIAHHEAESVKYFTALELMKEGQGPLAASSFAELGAESTGGYGMLARFRQAEVLSAADDRAGAVAIYDEIAGDSAVQSDVRGLAALFAAMRLMETASADELKTRLGALMVDDNPWRFSARELFGFVSYREGDLPTARDIFSALSNDANAPAGIKSRAAEMLAVVGIPGE